MNKIRKGDTVVVMSGKDKGRQGTVLSVDGEKVTVENINKAKKHQKPNPQRVQRLEREMQKLNERKALIEAKLADPAIYQDPEGLKAALLDQAYVAKELEQAESEWLDWADTAP